jgi:hypothetical protein
MEVKVVRFHPNHLEVMDVREMDAALFGSFKTKEGFDRIKSFGDTSIQAATFHYDGRILFIAGFFQLWPGVYEVWLLPSKHIGTAPRSFARLIRRYIDRIWEDFKAHRIQTTSFHDAFHARWMEFLGFESEGVLRKFTQDQRDMVQYSRIKK